jgi:hypothetical protein
MDLLMSGVGDYVGRLSRLLGIMDVEMEVEEGTGADKTLDVVVDDFNQVNSGGTKLFKGDLALAATCADWPQARNAMKARLKEWTKADYQFNLDWLLRSVNTGLTGGAKFQFLHDKTAGEIQDGVTRATKHIDTSLNLIGAGSVSTTTRWSSVAVASLARRAAGRAGPLHRLEPRRPLLPGAPPVDPHARGP